MFILRSTLEAHDSVFSVAFSHDNKTLASGSCDKTIKLWDVSGDTPKEKATLRAHTEDNPYCTCSHNWNSYIHNPSCPVIGHWRTVVSVAFSHDNKTLASASEDDTVILWDVSGDTPKGKGILKGFKFVNCVAFSPDNKTLASVDRDEIKLWDVSGDTPKEKGTLRGHTEENPECTCTHGYYDSDYKANPLCPVRGHLGSVYSVAFSHDNKTLASASCDKTIKLWDVSGDTPKEKATLTGQTDHVRCVAFSPDNKTLASCSTDKTVKLWDVSGDTPKEKGTLRGHSREVYSVAFSPDNKTLASASDDETVKLWNTNDVIQLLCELEFHHHFPRFMEEKIECLNDVMELNETDLEKLGLKIGERKRFMREVKLRYP